VSGVELRLIILGAGLLVSGIVAFVRFRRRIARLEAKIKELRAIGMRPLKYRRVERDDPQHAGKVAELDAVNGELAAAGVTVLGDGTSDAEKQPVRWFVDADGTTFGWIAILQHPTKGALRVCVLFSRKGDTVYYTRRTVGQVALAQPPFVVRQTLPIFTSLAATLAAHRKLASLPGDGFERIATLDQAMAELEQLRTRSQAWREAEPPGSLLDRDLREILGKHYDRLAPHLARRFDVELPRARVV
jgi:hypothetical protein